MSPTNSSPHQPVIVSVFNQKGGVGKTMLCMQLAGAFGQQGYRASVVDLDMQGTSTMWAHHQTDYPKKRFNVTVYNAAPARAEFLRSPAMRSAVGGSDIVFLDCPPSTETTVPFASLLAADLALIPVLPAAESVWASRQAEQLVQQASLARKQNGGKELMACYVINKVRASIPLIADTIAAFREHAAIPVCQSEIGDRTPFLRSSIDGVTVHEYGAAKARDEIDSLAGELAKMLRLPKMKT